MVSTLALPALLWLRFLALLHVSLAQDDDEHKALDHACTLYMAPSTLVNAGIGVFTAEAKLKGETIGAPDLYIPLVDIYKNDGGRPKHWPLGDYVWGGADMGMFSDSQYQDVTAYCPGLDAAVNGGLQIINVGKSTPQFDFTLHRSKDPGAGAITPYHNGTTLVTRDIPAGGEVFKDYGDGWFTSRQHLFENIPLSEHYEEAEEWAEEFDLLLEEEHIPEIPALREDLWNLVVSLPWDDSLTYRVFPKTYEQVLQTLQHGIRSTLSHTVLRSRTYLHKNGRCMDHIVPRWSTLVPAAGRGAFAKGFFPRNTVITGSPLLALSRDTLHMYEMEGTSWYKQRNVDKRVGHQLLINYCLGHSDTTLLLCPYGAGVNYMNHNQTLANVKIQWAPDGILNQNDMWFDMAPEDMRGNHKTNLAIDYVALRDIQKGEELFLEYGDDFERAWRKHVAHWKPPKDSDSYVSAQEWNEQFQRTPIHTTEEQDQNSYPPNLLLRCHSKIADLRWNDDTEWDELWTVGEEGVPCDVLARYETDNGILYDVAVREKGQVVEYTGVPRELFPASMPSIPLTFIYRMRFATRWDSRTRCFPTSGAT